MADRRLTTLSRGEAGLTVLSDNSMTVPETVGSLLRKCAPPRYLLMSLYIYRILLTPQRPDLVIGSADAWPAAFAYPSATTIGLQHLYCLSELSALSVWLPAVQSHPAEHLPRYAAPCPWSEPWARCLSPAVACRPQQHQGRAAQLGSAWRRRG